MPILLKFDQPYLIDLTLSWKQILDSFAFLEKLINPTRAKRVSVGIYLFIYYYFFATVKLTI